MNANHFFPRAVRVLALFACVFAAAAVNAADTDGDGIDDAIDNCTQVANPEQRDTNSDGFGNDCDPDLDNNLVVNFADLNLFSLAFFSTAEDSDLNGDGLNNFADLAIVRAFFFGPPGPGAPDADADGVMLSEDLCEESPPGAESLLQGCSAFDLAEDPDKFMTEVMTQTGALIARVIGDPDAGFLQDNLTTAELQFGNGTETVRRGELCDGLDGLFGGVSALNATHAQLTTLINDTEAALAVGRPITARDCARPSPPAECEFGADHMESDGRLMSFLLLRTDLQALTTTAEEIALQFKFACSASSSGAVAKGTVTEMEPHRNRLFLDDGTYVGISDGADLLPDIYPGRQVAVFGTGYGGAVLGDTIIGIGPEGPLAGFLTYETCVKLRFAPFQPFPPLNPGPYTFHEPSAYRSGSTHRLEQGMRLSAENIPFCGDSLGPYSVRYSLNLSLQFVNKATGLTETWVLANELDESDAPVSLPSQIKLGTDATLFVSHQRQSCEVINLPRARAPGNSYFICSEIEEYASETLTLQVYEKGSFCSAEYAQREFQLEEVSQTTFDTTYITGKTTSLVSPDPGNIPAVVALGYEVYGPSSSSYPALKQIDEGEPFAVFEHDCVTTPGLLYVEGSCGTKTPSALRWPRLVGERAGRPFSYSCKLPRIIRDFVDACVPPPHSYYKLPFFGGFPTWLMGQGNNGTFTHNGNQAFAFDFVADTGTLVRAARGGLVTFVRENQTGNTYFDPGCTPCMANAVNILHQDGTVGQYFHFRPNGVDVVQGQRVNRGDVVGRVGNTGYSTDPHLHFHVVIPDQPTIPLRFESLDNGIATPPSACYIPVPGDTLNSDNN